MQTQGVAMMTRGRGHADAGRGHTDGAGPRRCGGRGHADMGVGGEGAWPGLRGGGAGCWIRRGVPCLAQRVAARVASTHRMPVVNLPPKPPTPEP